MFQCSYCNYESIYKYNVQRHEHVHNKNSTQNNIAPTRISVDSNVNNLLNQPTQHGVAAKTTSSTLPNNDLIKAVDSAHSWKNVCENLQQDKCADESWIRQQDAEILNLRNKLQEFCNANKNWEEAYRLLQENSREDGENSHAIITYLQNVLNANNISYNLDLA